MLYHFLLNFPIGFLKGVFITYQYYYFLNIFPTGFLEEITTLQDSMMIQEYTSQRSELIKGEC